MSISTLANVFNSVYIRLYKVMGCVYSQFNMGGKADSYETKQTDGAFICEFFAGVAPPHYALKRD